MAGYRERLPLKSPEGAAEMKMTRESADVEWKSATYGSPGSESEPLRQNLHVLCKHVHMRVHLTAKKKRLGLVHTED